MQSAGTQAVRFVLDGRVVEVDGLPTTTVLQYLREHAGRSGTKEGCAEGDCGACTVVLGELDDDRTLRYRAINSCIRFLPTIDGKELVTVESLQAPDGSLHPVQQAMADEHASQCGFCTPGFVMSLFALYLRGHAPERGEVVDALSGNLCRCTGYRPIIDAGCAMSRYPEPTHWPAREVLSAARADALRALERDTALALPGYSAPRTMDEVAEALASHPGALVLAGGTDVGLWVTKQLRELPHLVYVGDVAELRRLRDTPDGLEIGAAVSLTDAWEAIVARHPPLAELAHRFASPPVRNSGTLVGNIANGSPIGDSMPALIALGAGLTLRRGAQIRQLPLERFYLGYQNKDLAAGEVVVAVTVPAPRPGQFIASYKLSKRIDQDISAVCAGFAVTLEDGRVSGARLAYGGMAATPRRAAAAEAALLGQPWSASTIDRAITALAGDFEPLGDLRASAAYRLQTAGNLLRRFFLARSADAPPLRTHEAVA